MGDDNKQLARRALDELYEKGQLDLADELIHPAFVDHDHAHDDQLTGPESVKRTVARLRSAFGTFGSRLRLRSPRRTRSFNS